MNMNTNIGHSSLGADFFSGSFLLYGQTDTIRYLLPYPLTHSFGRLCYLFRSDLGVWNFSKWNTSRCDRGKPSNGRVSICLEFTYLFKDKESISQRRISPSATNETRDEILLYYQEIKVSFCIPRKFLHYLLQPHNLY